jgi:hypothetical protein
MFNMTEMKMYTICANTTTFYNFGVPKPIQSVTLYINPNCGENTQVYALYSQQLSQLSNLVINIDINGNISTSITPVS